MDVNSWATHPSLDMGFDRTVVNGANYLFGESVSLINFTKVCTAFVFSLHVLAGKPLSSVLATQYCYM